MSLTLGGLRGAAPLLPSSRPPTTAKHTLYGTNTSSVLNSRLSSSAPWICAVNRSLVSVPYRKRSEELRSQDGVVEREYVNVGASYGSAVSFVTLIGIDRNMMRREAMKTRTAVQVGIIRSEEKHRNTKGPRFGRRSSPR
ncbi:hypothetical protein EYF80_010719 [Liparis tanakae]|uniref:Uncharacterized protein n=1 Tax=Liparis tanakae TaxID=230148 RepID=A0A4Z2ILW8_9TELE|nr:hypothetical protein EYF80_010719 [Liparis tanakae]